MEVNCEDSDETVFALSFSDFPEDVQLFILSFLDPSELASFACTSKKCFSLCRDESLWFSMCDRRWGSCTLLKRWGQGKISYKDLYRILSEYENLIGFWRRYRINTTSVNLRMALSCILSGVRFILLGQEFRLQKTDLMK
ncbi:F-box At3g12350 [Olea europaea subsp. europaea]|uniref:F-box protein n=1 Tax=Olea europaea subsp. europaea TaxID=158383 RepID=A0A8S0PIL3_OLEEU|nr:F-box At3g12350 [Olea europaea subsp. europaea]